MDTRIIKFRVREKCSGVIVGFEIINSKNSTTGTNNFKVDENIIRDGLLIHDKETIREESTEFSDSKFNQIYENDIFDWASHSRGIVQLINGQWSILNRNGVFPVCGYCFDGVVVGNTLSNKDLLNHIDLVK